MRFTLLLALTNVALAWNPSRGSTFVAAGRRSVLKAGLNQAASDLPQTTTTTRRVPTSTPKAKLKKVRVDDLLVSRSVVDDLKAAKALVLAGNVFIRSDHKVTSPAIKVSIDTPFRIRSKRDHPWVSRGGLKLSHAIDTWPELRASMEGSTAIDVGSSTGGFTDVLLSAGASRVFAVDVGRGILDWRLRSDPRVILKESFNARSITAASLGISTEKEAETTSACALLTNNSVPSVIVCDASFIRLSSVLPAALDLCSAGGVLVALVKPQFEARREQVEKGGIVRDPLVHAAVCSGAAEWIETQPGGWSVVEIVPSPIQGRSGNTEFLLFAKKGGQ